MKLIFSERAWEEYLHWQANDEKEIKRIHLLLKGIKRSSCEGIGKPEALKHALAGYWSRRITDEHRLVYKVVGDEILIVQLRYHYGK